MDISRQHEVDQASRVIAVPGAARQADGESLSRCAGSESHRGAHTFHMHLDDGLFVRDPQYDAAAAPASPGLPRSFPPDVRFVCILLRLPTPRDLRLAG
jgi:hypothetical protein